MSIDIHDYRTGHATMPSHEAFAQALDPSASFLERLVVIEGGAGSGKSFTLASAASSARASGHQVIEIRGQGDDIVMASASLSALLTLLPQTARPHAVDDRRFGDDDRDSRHVILVDDWQELDRGTREQLHANLTFLSRTTRTVSVVSTSDRLLFPGWNSLRLVALKPLVVQEAEAFIYRTGIDLPPSRRRLLLRLAAGNPLILDVIGHAWSAFPWETKVTIFPAYPSSPRIIEPAVERLAKLSRFTRARLLVAAVAQVEFAAELPTASALELADEVAEAFRAGLAFPTQGSVQFDTPVTRAALLCLATEKELAAARAEVAAITASPDHLSLFVEAAAAEGLDDRLADRMAEAAEACIASGKPHEGTAAFLSASHLASVSKAQADFLVRAADNAAYTGQFVVVEDCVKRMIAEGQSYPAILSAAVQFVHVIQRGADRRVKRDLLALLDTTPDGDTADRILSVLHLACLSHGDSSWWEVVAASRGGRAVDPVLLLVENCLETGLQATREARHLVAEASRSASDGATWKQVSLHVAWMLLDPTDPRRAQIDQLFARAESEEDLPGLLHIYRSAVACVQRGGWQRADELLETGRALAERLGAQTLVALFDANRLILLSLRGDPEKARAAADAATSWALDHGTPFIARVADHARSAIDLAAGNFEEAYARSAASPPASGRWLRGGYGPIELLDAVEAAARLRLPDHGRALLDTATTSLGELPSARHQMILAACRAILDDDNDGREQFEEALAAVASTDLPFEAARVRLAYGERLRRTMNPLEARAQFRIAAAAFETLGAQQWRLRAQRELRAAGGIPEASQQPMADGVLSEQERQVASLAAHGLTNKQIASQLYLSPRTVSGHLYRVFPKLGVTSRAGLRDALIGISESGAVSGNSTAGAIAAAAG